MTEPLRLLFAGYVAGAASMLALVLVLFLAYLGEREDREFYGTRGGGYRPAPAPPRACPPPPPRSPSTLPPPARRGGP